jgi:ASC-1-like (ASCH) protein
MSLTSHSIVMEEVFEWIRTGQKTIELRRGRAREGDKAVFQCGRNTKMANLRLKSKSSP